MFTCQGLAKHYGTITALSDIALSVESGLVGLLGPNGAGKSTLLSVLLGQTPASAGGATVLGFDVRRQQRLIRQRVGFMPENDCLIPGMSGTGYVHYAGRLAGMTYADAMQRAHEVLDYVDLGEARYRPAGEYSAGMRQRLKLAQALVHDPDVLFLDEPTNGMDPQGRHIMLSLITDLGRAGIGIVLSSHLLPDVERVCERVIIMGGGEILATGNIDEMQQPHPTLYSIVYTGEADGFARRLQELGVTIESRPETPENHGAVLAVRLPEAGRQHLILEAAHDTGVSLRGLHPKRSSLEETFMAAISKQQPR